MKKEICLDCWHWPICWIAQKARQHKIYLLPNEGIEEFYKKEAENCDYFERRKK